MAADEYEYKETRAARMLSEGLRRASSERGLSVRQLGKKLNYKQAVDLSHWATGRLAGARVSARRPGAAPHGGGLEPNHQLQR